MNFRKNCDADNLTMAALRLVCELGKEAGDAQEAQLAVLFHHAAYHLWVANMRLIEADERENKKWEDEETEQAPASTPEQFQEFYNKLGGSGNVFHAAYDVLSVLRLECDPRLHDRYDVFARALAEAYEQYEELVSGVLELLLANPELYPKEAATLKESGVSSWKSIARVQSDLDKWAFKARVRNDTNSEETSK